MRQPLVTVGMAVYRGEAHIADAIRSVIAGSYPHWELLAVDDCSPDGSADIVRQFADPRIRLVTNDVNTGLVGVRNRIMREASGTYIAWLDQDDLAYPERLAAQVAYMDDHPDVGACGSWSDLLTEQLDGSFAAGVERFPSDHAAIRAEMLFLNPMACNTVMMRRAPFVDRGLFFREAYGNSLDYDMWSIASDDLLLHNLPTVLGAYRVHGSQTSQGAALENMNAQALRIQVELALRSLGITMTADDIRWHRLATVAPVAITEAAELEHVADWFGRLRSANASRHAFDAARFDRALSRQWTTVVRAAARSGISRSAVATMAAAGFRTIGVSPTSVALSVSAGVRRRLSRRT
jgi:glycosyltransferase involved in cell wall biosynthesis